jgi:methyl-accepting chemotaxis protein
MSTESTEQEARQQAMQEVDKINQETLFNIQIQLGIMRDENQQILELVRNASAQLNESFSQIATQTKALSDSVSDPDLVQALHSEVGQAVTTLQFEDMCSQLVTHLDKRFDAVSELTQVISAMSFFELDLDNIDEYQSQLAYAKKLAGDLGAALKSTVHNPVSQHSLDSGDIELF